MSKYTTEVRYICENYAGLLESKGYSNVDEIIESARSKVFDFNYPIFDEAYKSVLESKILKHFYTREIGAETVGLWKLWLNRKMNEVMPYYNQLYKSELLEFNPFYDVDYTRTQTGNKQGTREDNGQTTGTAKEQKEATADRTIDVTENRNKTSNGTANGTVTENRTKTGNGTGTTTNSGNNKDTEKNSENNYYSDTPQGGIGNLEEHTYLTNARLINKDGENSSNYSSNGETSYSDSNTEKNNTENTQTNSGESTETGSVKNVDGYIASDEIQKEHSGTSKLNSVLKNTEEYLETVKGKQSSVSYSKILEEYRNTFLNIDMQVINELNDLFMNLW